MNEIKKYKQLTKICLYKGDDIVTSMPITDLYNFLNSWIKFMNLDWKIININDIRIAEIVNVDSVESFILLQNKDIQIKIRNRNIERKLEKLKEFENIQQIQNYLERI